MKKIFQDRIVSNTLLLFVFTYATEMYVRFLTDGGLGFPLIRIAISSFIISLLLSYILHFTPKIFQKIINTLYMFFVSIYSFVEFGLFNFIGFFMGMGNAEQGTKVLDYILDFIKSTHWYYWIIFVPLIFGLIFLYFVLPKLNKNNKDKKEYTKTQRITYEVLPIIILVCLSGFYYLTIRSDKFSNKLQVQSNYELWLFPENSNLAVNNFGVLMYGFCDAKSIILGIDANDIMKLENNNTEGASNNTEEVVETDYTRTIDDSAWKMLMDNTTDSTDQSLNAYFISREITEKNDYTGIFKGKNLIMMLMESVDEISILNENDFPTLYKLYHEGISFRNNYSPRNNCSTGNNETTVLTSLFTINNTCTANTYKDNLYTEAAFNIFDNAGYNTTAYHDYTEHYYYRATYMPNMGANHYYGVADLGMEYSDAYQEWPSDVVLFQQARKYYQDNEPYFAYFTGVTTHQPYYQSSEWGDAYLSRFDNTSYSIELKRYLSKMTVLDKALEELLNELKENNELDNTVIVLYGDHFPYGLTDDQINEYLTTNNASYTVNRNSTTRNDVDRTPLIIYNSEFAEENGPVEVTDYTSIIDLLPTILNMFDLDYDPRLYLGTDVFSDSHVSRTVFADGSWEDERAYYYAPSSKITYVDGAEQYTAEEIKEINQEISKRQQMSASAIKSDYFNYLSEGIKKYQAIIDSEKEATTTASSDDESETETSDSN